VYCESLLRICVVLWYLCIVADVSVDMPDVIDISYLRGAGKQPNEEELADAAPVAAPGQHLYLLLMSYCTTLFCKGICCTFTIISSTQVPNNTDNR